MDAQSVYSRVNDALVEIHRSLVQYTTEVINPWSASEENELKRVVLALAAEQESHVKKLVQYLIGNGQRVDFGVYPQHYGGLHFVEIGFLRSQLIENMQSVVEEVKAVVADLTDDQVAHDLVKAALDSQENCLKQLVETKLPVS